MMATLTPGFSFGATESVTNTKLGLLVSAGSVTGIVNADVDAGAAIANSKLNLASVAQAVSFAGTVTTLGSLVASGGLTASAGLTMSGSAFKSAVATLTDGSAVALDASLGNNFRLAAGGNRTISIPSNSTAFQKIIIQHYASAGARTLSLASSASASAFRFGSDVTALTETASGKTDYIGIIYSGADSFWDVVGVVKGY